MSSDTEHAARRHDTEPDDAEKVRRAIDLVPDAATAYQAREGLAGLEGRLDHAVLRKVELGSLLRHAEQKRDNLRDRLRQIRDLLDPDAPGHDVSEAYELADEALEGGGE